MMKQSGLCSNHSGDDAEELKTKNLFGMFFSEIWVNRNGLMLMFGIGLYVSLVCHLEECRLVFFDSIEVPVPIISALLVTIFPIISLLLKANKMHLTANVLELILIFNAICLGRGYCRYKEVLTIWTISVVFSYLFCNYQARKAGLVGYRGKDMAVLFSVVLINVIIRIIQNDFAVVEIESLLPIAFAAFISVAISVINITLVLQKIRLKEK